MSTNYIGKNSLTRFLEKLYETFSKKGHAHSKADILDFPSLEGFVTEVYVTNQIASKQDAITGTAGQFVVIGENGKPTTKTIPYAEEATF